MNGTASSEVFFIVTFIIIRKHVITKYNSNLRTKCNLLQNTKLQNTILTYVQSAIYLYKYLKPNSLNINRTLWKITQYSLNCHLGICSVIQTWRLLRYHFVVAMAYFRKHYCSNLITCTLSFPGS